MPYTRGSRVSATPTILARLISAAVTAACALTLLLTATTAPANAGVRDAKIGVSDPRGDVTRPRHDIVKVELSDNRKRIYLRIHLAALRPSNGSRAHGLITVARPGKKARYIVLNGALMNHSTGHKFCRGSGKTMTTVKSARRYLTISFPKSCLPRWKTARIYTAQTTEQPEGHYTGLIDSTRGTMNWLRIRG